MTQVIAEPTREITEDQSCQPIEAIRVYSDIKNQAAQNSSPAPVHETREPEPIQLSPAELAQFISQGCLKLDSGLPRSFHDYMVAQLSESVQGNNVVPSCPDLEKIYQSPRISGAIQSILGKEYCLHSHRHLHMSPSGSEVGGWHKDSQWGYGKRQRNNRPRWVMLLYFPNELPEEIGGTGVIPGLQYTHQRQSDEDQKTLGKGTVGDAGTCVLMHYDTWHAKFRNSSSIDRIMVKLQFFALSNPEPRADLGSWNWSSVGPISQQGLWEHIWSWFGGQNSDRQVDLETESSAIAKLNSSTWWERNVGADKMGSTDLSSEGMRALVFALEDENEVVATNAAVSLANQGAEGMEALGKAFLSTDVKNEQSLIQGLIVAGEASAEILLKALAHKSFNIRSLASYGLGELMVEKTEHAKRLGDLVENDPELTVRVNAAYALGIHPLGHLELEALFACLQDEEDELRMFAMYSILRHASHASHWEHLVVRTLSDGNRYLKALAVEVLHRLNTPTSLQAVISYLKTHRWCEQNGTRGGF